MTWSPASALFGSTVMEEARQHDGSAACSARALISRSIRRFMMRALRQDGAIRAALAGVACPGATGWSAGSSADRAALGQGTLSWFAGSCSRPLKMSMTATFAVAT